MIDYWDDGIVGRVVMFRYVGDILYDIGFIYRGYCMNDIFYDCVV